MPSLLSPISVAQSAAWKRRLNPLYNAAGSGVGHGDFGQTLDIGQAQAALIERLGAPIPAGDWLQLNCGAGGASPQILARADSLTGVDADPAQIDAARRSHPRPRFVVSDTERLPFAQERFDAVLGVQGFSHARDLSHALHQAWTVLKPGGWLALADFATQPQHHQLADRAKVRVIAASLGGLRLQPMERWQGHLSQMGMVNIQLLDLSAAMAKGLSPWADALLTASEELGQRASARVVARSYRTLARAGAGGPLRYIALWARKP